MDSIKIIAVTIMMLAVVLMSINSGAAVPKQKMVYSSLEKFTKCVDNQNKVDPAQVRIFWDVQAASCFAMLSTGQVMPWTKLEFMLNNNKI